MELHLAKQNSEQDKLLLEDCVEEQSQLQPEKKKIEVSVGCLFSEEMNEDDEHIMIRCAFVRQVWALSNIPWAVIGMWHGAAENWLRWVHYKLDEQDSD